MIIALQALVLVLTCVLWWRARQDLDGRRGASAGQEPPLADWERLRSVVEQLTADLERRAVVAEQRVAAAEERLRAAMGENAPLPTFPSSREGQEPLPPPPSEGGGQEGVNAPALPADPDRFAEAERLVAAGLSDPVEIARQAGVSRGEAELLLSLTGRRAR